MVSQTTQDFVFSIVDANIEYNIKILLSCLLFGYMVFSLWWANKIIPFKATQDEIKKFPVYKQISVKLMRVFPIVFFFFMPLVITIFSYRTYALDNIITLMLTFYGVMTMIGLGVWFLFGMDWIQNFLSTIGIQTKEKHGTIIRRKD
jgi:hypothetical protein